MRANYIYLTATLDAATWGAELAVGEGPGRIYRVEPTGPFEDDPNLTDKRFQGNLTRSYRTLEPQRVVGEVQDWEPHSPEVLQDMRDHLEELKRFGIDAINDSVRKSSHDDIHSVGVSSCARRGILCVQLLLGFEPTAPHPQPDGLSTCYGPFSSSWPSSR